MKAATINEIKRELNILSPAKVQALCLRLAKYKKENKEFLTYLLFESDNEQDYIKSVKEMIDEQFEFLFTGRMYHVIKSTRKVLRIINKYINFSDEKQTEVELLLYFCTKIKKSGADIESYPVFEKLYQRQIEKILKAVATLHEDLQHDYERELEEVKII